MTSRRGIYIHMPFCRQRCFYCHFNSQTDLSLMEGYVQALIKEIDRYRDELQGVQTIYLGGGTPGLFEISHLQQIVEALAVDPVEEFTIEVNPESVNLEKLKGYRKLGINRISMGVQSTDDKLLKSIGRLHTFKTVEEAVAMIRNAGFDNLSLDLMYGLPGQAVEGIVKDVSALIELGLEHLSTYSLTIDEGTVFHQRKVQAVDDELDREMFHAIRKKVEASGMKRYEISNFAKPGYESRHNLLYWRCNEYIGLGAGAHGYIHDKRYSNIESVASYIRRMGSDLDIIDFEEKLNQEEKIFEHIMLNLRTTDGFDLDEFKALFGFDFLKRYHAVVERFTQYNAMEIDEGRVYLTRYGLDIANTIDQAFR